MAQSQLVLHRGARPVTLEELAAVPAPPAEGRWRPQPHAAVLTSVKETLGEFGYSVKTERLGLSRNDARFFGTLDLETPLVEGVALAVGVRSSIDKSFPLGFAAGSRVFCCDNLALNAELIVRRKHTTNSVMRFRDDIAQAVNRLSGYRELETARIARMQDTEVPPELAESYLLKMFERGIIPGPAPAPRHRRMAHPDVRRVQGPDLLVAPERRHHGPRGDLQGRPAEVRAQDNAPDGHAVPGPAAQLAPRKGVDSPMSQPPERRQSCPARRRPRGARRRASRRARRPRRSTSSRGGRRQRQRRGQKARPPTRPARSREGRGVDELLARR